MNDFTFVRDCKIFLYIKIWRNAEKTTKQPKPKQEQKPGHYDEI